MGEFDGPGSSQRTQLLRVFDRHTPRPAISEFTLDLFAEIPRAHHQIGDPLVAELPHQKLEERLDLRLQLAALE